MGEAESRTETLIAEIDSLVIRLAGRPELVGRLQSAKRELQQLFTQVRRIREQTEAKILAIPV